MRLMVWTGGGLCEHGMNIRFRKRLGISWRVEELLHCDLRFSAVSMKMDIFWHVPVCSLLGTERRFSPEHGESVLLRNADLATSPHGVTTQNNVYLAAVRTSDSTSQKTVSRLQLLGSEELRKCQRIKWISESFFWIVHVCKPMSTHTVTVRPVSAPTRWPSLQAVSILLSNSSARTSVGLGALYVPLAKSPTLFRVSWSAIELRIFLPLLSSYKRQSVLRVWINPLKPKLV
jgi:hypothetical protein